MKDRIQKVEKKIKEKKKLIFESNKKSSFFAIMKKKKKNRSQNGRKRKPDFFWEKKFWQKGYLVVGVDEVGRGALAGPVIAAAAALKISSSWQKRGKMLEKISQLGIDDSKRLSFRKREKLVKVINRHFFWATAEASVREINRLGILKATQRAMRRALFQIRKKIVARQKKNFPTLTFLKKRNGAVFPKLFALIDGFPVRYLAGFSLKNQKALIRGDSRSVSIAAASILAKVYRDNLMQKISQSYRKYHWEKNKGYGTKAHFLALKNFGPSQLHRQKFID